MCLYIQVTLLIIKIYFTTKITFMYMNALSKNQKVWHLKMNDKTQIRKMKKIAI